MLSKTLMSICSQSMFNKVCPEHWKYSQDLINQFDQHIHEFGLRYGTHQERAFRFQIFAEKDAKISEINASQSSFKVGHNQFSTYSDEEYKALLSIGLGEQESQAIQEKYEKVELPDSIDWRQQGAIGPVHNMGQMVIPFAEIDAISAAEIIQTGKMFDISVQQFEDCATDRQLYESAYKYAKAYGFESSQDYPASPRSDCHFEAAKVKVKVDSIKKVEGTIEAIKTALVDKPVTVVVDASNVAFQTYSGGVLAPDHCGTTLNHELLVVGYGKYDGGDYFICKNSWGASWGDQGYIKLEATEGKGTCGMNQAVEQPTLESEKCFSWNRQMWVGKSPKNPVYTICGLEECVKCPTKTADI